MNFKSEHVTIDDREIVFSTTGERFPVNESEDLCIMAEAKGIIFKKVFLRIRFRVRGVWHWVPTVWELPYDKRAQEYRIGNTLKLIHVESAIVPFGEVRNLYYALKSAGLSLARVE
jgi:hypothetical protein